MEEYWFLGDKNILLFIFIKHIYTCNTQTDVEYIYGIKITVWGMKWEKKKPCQIWVVVRNKHGEILLLYIAIPYFINSTEHTLLYYELQRKEKGRKGKERENEKKKANQL